MKDKRYKVNSDKFIRPKKSLGQNFLINQGVVKKIIAAAELKNSDNVLEVGPGKGALSFSIAKQVKYFVAVEKDNTDRKSVV